MKIYLKSGQSIKITQSIANKLWKILTTEGIREKYFRLFDTDNGNTFVIVSIEDISCVK